MPQDWLKKCLAEFIGTFALVFIGAGSIIVAVWTGAGDLTTIALAHGLTLGVMVSATGAISGGHINPAVTFGFLVTGRIDRTLGAAYILSQLLGGILASILLVLFLPQAPREAVDLGATGLGMGVSATQGMFIEMVLTFFLVLVVFLTAVDPRAPKSIAGFGIGMTLALGIMAGGPLTGASMNPARSFGPAIMSGFWSDHWVYWVGPGLGGALAGLLYHHILAQKETG